MRTLAVVVASLCACGRVGFDASSDSGLDGASIANVQINFHDDNGGGFPSGAEVLVYESDGTIERGHVDPNAGITLPARAIVTVVVIADGLPEKGGTVTSMWTYEEVNAGSTLDVGPPFAPTEALTAHVTMGAFGGATDYSYELPLRCFGGSGASAGVFDIGFGQCSDAIPVRFTALDAVQTAIAGQLQMVQPGSSPTFADWETPRTVHVQLDAIPDAATVMGVMLYTHTAVGIAPIELTSINNVATAFDALVLPRSVDSVLIAGGPTSLKFVMARPLTPVAADSYLLPASLRPRIFESTTFDATGGSWTMSTGALGSALLVYEQLTLPNGGALARRTFLPPTRTSFTNPTLPADFAALADAMNSGPDNAVFLYDLDAPYSDVIRDLDRVLVGGIIPHSDSWTLSTSEPL